jgi:membrane protein
MDLLRPIRKFDHFQQKHTALAVPAATLKKFQDDNAANYAVVVAFYAFYAVFPLLLVFVTVLGFVLSGDHSALVSVRDSVLGRFPVIGDALEHDQLKGSALALVAGILLSLLSSLGVTSAATHALDHVWDIPQHERHNFFQKKLRGLLLVLGLGTLFVVASAASGLVGGGLGGPELLVFGIVVSIPLNLGLFLASFRFLCSDAPGWRDQLPGAIAAAILWELLQLLGGVYIGHITHSRSPYGTFALVLGVLTWLHLGAQMTVYCAELNTVLAKRAWPRALFDDPASSTVPAPSEL